MHAVGRAYTSGRLAMEHKFSPDNYTLGRYSYLMLHMPPRFIDGKQVYWLETRLLNRLRDAVYGPEDVARLSEAYDRTSLSLKSRESTSPEWLEISPKLEVKPGEKLVLRFEFPEGRNSAGWMVMQSASGYQELYLNPGYPGTGFGTGPHASNVTALTNSGNHTQIYRIEQKVDPGNTMPRDGGEWAKLHVSRYQPEMLPVEIKSLMPFRARVQAEEHGYLESPRQWLPGYEAWVDGNKVVPVTSKDGMVAVPIPAGDHEVELKFEGSIRLWIGFWLAGLTAIGALGWHLGGKADGMRSIMLRMSQAFAQWKTANQA